ncbi:cysteine-rich repeat secretory protein 38-like isoform X2 [Vicia villosa]|uniref:cysteine-rich repeat secretory protein 38-like isoform X2 n=1 Tax=Vicia villosa TaxID=3911 RepID=UPI00273ADA4F|nr:cysteine-rich repeat secretory protein 38-like isoform X2 [Vicia villosa]
MLSLRCLLFLSLPLFFTLNSQANDQLVFRYHKCNNDLGNFTDGSTYQNNLATVLKNIYSNKEIDYGFYNFSYGQKPDKVSAIGFCRGDLNPNDCRDCLKSSAVLLTDRCPIQKEAIGYYDLCMLRYSNASIFGVMDTDTGYVYDIENKTGVDDAFSQTLNGLLDELKSTAAEGDWRKKFGIKSVKVNESNNNNNETIYGLVQCTPDLTKKSCTKCLDSAYGRSHQHHGHRKHFLLNLHQQTRQSRQHHSPLKHFPLNLHQPTPQSRRHHSHLKHLLLKQHRQTPPTQNHQHHSLLKHLLLKLHQPIPPIHLQD